MTAALTHRGANDVDIHVGGQVRVRRKLLGISQERLADALGITFQQIQKYERGANRISASKLYAVAQVLNAPIAYFFEGLTDSESAETVDQDAVRSEQTLQRFLATPEGLELAEAFPRVRGGRQRRHLLDLVKAMTQVDA